MARHDMTRNVTTRYDATGHNNGTTLYDTIRRDIDECNRYNTKFNAHADVLFAVTCVC
jgi:hypothetical protein